jgi:hypothetical protein
MQRTVIAGISARLADAIEHVRWRLWHGQVARALDLIGDTLVTLSAKAEAKSSIAVVAGKVGRVPRDLEVYVGQHSELIIDDATARRYGKQISTAPIEGTVRWLLRRRMAAQQQMRWSARGAHLMLKVRTPVVNGTFDRDHAPAERWARRPFRQAA